MSPLLNYTTEVSATKTAAEVQALLVKAGATQIMVEYQHGRCVGFRFAVHTAMGRRAFTLPVHTERVLAVLRRERVAPRYQTQEQAERVGWRILKDWVEAQLAIVKTEMVTLDQVMLPYMHTGGPETPTFYELAQDQYAALPAGEAGAR